MVTTIRSGTQLCIYLKGQAQLRSLKPPNAPLNMGSPWIHYIFASFLYWTSLIFAASPVCSNNSVLVWLPPTVLESSCHSKGRVIPGRQHHHTTPLLNRQQKITPAFQPQQQQPIGFGQVSTLRVLHTSCQTSAGTPTNVVMARHRASLFHFHGGLCCDFMCDCLS